VTGLASDLRRLHFTEDAVLLAYCAGDPKLGHLNQLRLRRASLSRLGGT
jgi:hypothetical protein